MQQQLLSAGQGLAAAPKLPRGPASTSSNPRKEKKRKEKRVPDNSPNNNNPATNTGPNTHTYADALRTPATQPHPPTEHAKHATNVEGWENLQKKSQGKKTTVPKLIPTMYPQAEQEVTCHFPSASPSEATLHAERKHTTRQAIADAVLH